MKTLIAIPCGEKIDVPFLNCLDEMEKVGECIKAYVSGSLIAVARNKLAQIAIEQECDQILWLDSDMTFDKDFMKNLQKDIDGGLDFVTALAFRRKPPYTPAIYETIRYGATSEENISKEYLDYPKNSLFEIDASGFAGVLMKTKMIVDVLEKKGSAFNPFTHYGEDISFCIRAKSLGYKLYCDSSVKMGHLTTNIINENVYEHWRESNNA